MKLNSANTKYQGMTLLEILVTIVVLLVLAAFLLPTSPRKKGSSLIRCMNNQRQLSVGFIMWNSDNTNRFPWQVAANSGGASEAATNGQAVPIFLCLSNYFPATHLFLCPSDTKRFSAASFGQLQDTNLSYFVSIDAGTNAAESVMLGDRHLADNGKPVRPGLLVYSAGSKVNWTRELHNSNPKTPMGVLSFEDGHTQAVKDSDLNSMFTNEQIASNRLVIP